MSKHETEWVTSQHQVTFHNDVGCERNTKHESELQVNIKSTISNLTTMFRGNDDSPYVGMAGANESKTRNNSFTNIVNTRGGKFYIAAADCVFVPASFRCIVGYFQNMRVSYKSTREATKSTKINDVGRERNTKHESELQVNMKSTMM